ncbi:MAG TPA: hypothetical protein VGS22_25690 [Thermoanaerobaculia bacterium]|jgi:hypothetical protein|nr:hypothetical protein [Thermoanaerobaculia bacterium]
MPEPRSVPTEGPEEPVESVDVAAALERLRAGVRQRRAELATLGDESEATKLRLLELKTLEWVEEPPLFSHRPGLGKLIVFLRKVFFHAFVKWYARPLLQRQNRFNQVASQLIQELIAQQTRLAGGVGRLEREVAAARAAEVVSPVSAPGPEPEP